MSDHRFVETLVGRLAVRTRGEGPPAVLWHSLFVDDRSWGRVEEALAAERRLIVITGPGHGLSGGPGRRYTMTQCAAAAVAVLDELGVDGPVDWVGNAWGGHVGVIVAALRPARCRTLVTIGTPIQAYTRTERAQVTLLLVAYVLAGPTRYLADGLAETMLSPRTRAEDPAAVDLLRRSFVDADRRGLANAVVSISLLRKDLSHLLPRIACPTLFITGADHPGWTPEQARAAAASLADGSVEVVPDAAYLVPLEAPQATADRLRRFWAAHPPTSAAT